MSATPEFVRSLYLPLTEDGILLPVANVAEIVAFAAPTALGTEGPVAEWIAGSVPWRGRALPVCTLERILGLPYETPGVRGRIVVLHGLTNNPRLPFFGVLIQGLPSMVLASSASVHWIPGKVDESRKQPVSTSSTDATAGDFVAGWVEASGRDAWIPAVDAIEAEVAAALPAA